MPGNDGHPRTIRFGAYELDEATHELRKNGLRIHLQDQPWEVLCALLERPGEVVSREDLQRRLWPDGTFVDYEKSLNKAVNKLREALCDSADNPRYVQTASRRGYRFLAPVAAKMPRAAGLGEAPREQSKTARSRSAIGWCALALSLVTVVLVTGLWPVPAPRAKVTQLTRGGSQEMGSLAAYGGRILYTLHSQSPDDQSVTQFWSISKEGGEPRRERMPFLGPKSFAQLCPLYSPPGVILVGTQAPSDNEIKGELWLARFDGSRPRRAGEALARDAHTVSPDLKILLRASSDGLFARPLDGGPERLLARLDWKESPDTFWHPSGKRIGLVHYRDGPRKLWEVNADGTTLHPLLPEFQGEQYAASWSLDGRRLYFVSDGELYMRGSRGWLGWMRRPEPQRLTAGPVKYYIASEDPTDPRVIYATGKARNGESMKLNKQSGLFESYLGGLSADCLDYSPDGQWIVYVAFPSRELWKCRRDGSDKVLLEDSLQTSMPRWSPDGKRIAFAAVKQGSSDFHRIYTIAADGGKAEPVKGVSGPGSDPGWSPDGKKLVFAPLEFWILRKPDLHVSIVDLETGAVETVPGSEGMFSPRWSPNSKHLVAIRGAEVRTALYDFATRRWTDIEAHGRSVEFPTWSKDSNYVYGIMYDPTRLVRIVVATRKVEEIRIIQEFGLEGNIFPGVSWTPDGEAVVLQDLSKVEIYRLDIEQ